MNYPRLIEVASITAHSPIDHRVADNLPLAVRAAREYRYPRGADEEDVTLAMEVLLRAAELFDATRGVKFSTYVWRAVCYGLRDKDRKNRRHRHFPLETAQHVPAPPSANRLEDAEQSEENRLAVRRVIAAMRPDDARLVEDYFLRGKTQIEIGKEIGVTSQAVRSRITRALAIARKHTQRNNP